MDLLDACLEKNVRLIDYERMCDETGNESANAIKHVVCVSQFGPMRLFIMH